jgi:hypothetical protein
MRVGPCSTHRRDEKFIQNFHRKSEGKNQLEEINVDGRTILERFLEK